MTMLQKIKDASVKERKLRSDMAVFSSFVLAEVQKIGKGKGNRETTDDEAIQVLKKISAVSAENNRIGEVAWIDTLLPSMATSQDIQEFLNSTFGTGAAVNKGIVMKALKERFGSLVDMKLAGTIAAEMFNI